MRKSHTCLCCLLAVFFLASFARAAVITVDADKSNAESDCKSLEVVRVIARGDQLFVIARNEGSKDQKVKLKFDSLSDGDYDVYVDGTISSTETAAELCEGIDCLVPGRSIDEKFGRCLRAMQPAVVAESRRLAGTDGDRVRAFNTISQVVSWVQSGISVDESYHSLIVSVVPVGSTAPSAGRTKLSPEDTKEALIRTCKSVQDARWRMYSELVDPIIRSEVVASMTPVRVTASICSGPQPRVTVQITNDCDLTARGTALVSVDSGWQAQPKSLTFSGLKSGESITLTFDIEGSEAELPTSATVSVEVGVSDGIREPKCTIQSKATRQ